LKQYGFFQGIKDLKEVQKKRDATYKALSTNKSRQSRQSKKSTKITSSEPSSFESKIIPGLKFAINLLREDNLEKIDFSDVFHNLGEVTLVKNMVFFKRINKNSYTFTRKISQVKP